MNEKDILIDKISEARKWSSKCLTALDLAKQDAKEAKDLHELAVNSVLALVDKLVSDQKTLPFDESDDAPNPDDAPVQIEKIIMKDAFKRKTK